ncbi:cytochrome P450 [Marasmius fiardii PR-910]|nr:cytochrome P450 [Marasmius fiardii PR-910]
MQNILLLFGFSLPILVFQLWQFVHRLALHPLRKFPGPVLAALTHYYRAYYEIFRNGGWVEHLEILHGRYGPVVRVGPNEVHFNLPDAYEEITTKHPKYARFYRYLAKPDAEALNTIVDPREASKRRGRIASYFSRKAVLQLEHLVQEKINTLTCKLSSYAASGRPVNMTFAYQATAIDIITSYLFAQELNALDYPDFRHPILGTIHKLLKNIWFSKYLPLPNPDKLPQFLLRWFFPTVVPVVKQQRTLAQQLKTMAEERPSTETLGHKVIFDVFLDEKADGRDSWVIPRHELLDEAGGLQIAGFDTIANTCIIGTYHILNNPKVYTTLREELDEAWSTSSIPPTYEALEKLPYLTAVIKESLCMSIGVVSAIPRLVEREGSSVLGIPIPVGTVVSCSSYFVHMNPHVFPNPTEFRPERWLNGPDSDVAEKYLVAFSKGPRMCIGINLAWCELYLIFGNVFRKFNMKVHNTTVKDLQFRDHYLPTYPGHLHAHILSSLE